MSSQAMLAKAKQMTIQEKLRKLFPLALEEWDKWDCVVYGPVGLDDPASITVYLYNRNGSKIKLTLPVASNMGV